MSAKSHSVLKIKKKPLKEQLVDKENDIKLLEEKYNQEINMLKNNININENKKIEVIEMYENKIKELQKNINSMSIHNNEIVELLHKIEKDKQLLEEELAKKQKNMCFIC